MKLRLSLAAAAAGILFVASSAFAQVAPPVVTGLSDDFTPHRSKTWTWSSTPSAGATYRFKIDKTPHYDTWPATCVNHDHDHDQGYDDEHHVGHFREGHWGNFFGCDDAFGNKTHATKHSGNGHYWLHVQAHTDDGGDGPIVDVEAVLDNERPKIAKHPDLLVDQAGDLTTVLYDLPTATDNIDPAVTVSCLPASGSGFAPGRHYVLCTATDTAGNKARSKFRVTVRNYENPVITLAFDTAPCGTDPECVLDATQTGGATVAYHVVSVVDPGHLYTPDQVSCSPASPFLFPNNVTTPIICSINVNHHKVFEETPASVTVNNTALPIIHLHGNASVSLAVNGIYFEQGALVTDVIDASVDTTVDSTDGPLKVTISGNVDTHHSGVYYVHYNATNSNGLDATEVIRTITVGAGGTTGGSGSGGGGGGGGGGGSSSGSNTTGQSFAPIDNSKPPTTSGGENKPKTNNDNGCTSTNPILFTRSLRLGSTGDDVRRLQQFLNTHGFPVAASGPGSAGNETNQYTDAVAAAVKKFQEAHPKEILIPQHITVGTGHFLSFTLRYANSVLKAEATVCPTTTPPPTTTTLPPVTPTAKPILFTRSLRLGSTGDDVRRLQQFLNTHGFPVAASGPGSAGNETTTFTQAVKDALIKFQEAHPNEILIPQGITAGTGNFYSFTRSYVNSLLQAGQ